jgi:hypothetical protein
MRVGVFAVVAALGLALVAAVVRAQAGEPQAAPLRVVAHLAVHKGGPNADVSVHRGFAYIGDYPVDDKCSGARNPGIAVVDVRTPNEPRVVSRLAHLRGSWTEDIVVYRATVGPLRGRDVAVSGVQRCDGRDARFRGVRAWDVTDPTHPRLLGQLGTGCCTAGVHAISVTQRADLNRVLVLATVPQSDRHDRRGRGDFRLIDATDPRRLRPLADWGVLSHFGRTPGRHTGCADLSIGHAATPSADGRRAFISYFDSGVVVLDISRPGRPRYVGRTTYGPRDDGDAHSTSYDDRRGLLFVADEDFCAPARPNTDAGWGYLLIYEAGDSTTPKQIGEFRTLRSRSASMMADAAYSIHDPLLIGNTLYASWYDDGVRVLDVTDPVNPREIAWFDERVAKSRLGSIWGIAVDPATGLIYASGMGSGLWILERAG